MAKRIIVDPITRIEGHLRIEVELDDNNTIKDAWSSITLWRGIETILKGSDPRDAGLMTQRFCGVCTYVHYEASILACEDAFGVKPPTNARIVRNLINASLYMTDHIMHFYHLHGLDWVDVVSALVGGPEGRPRIWPRASSDNPYNCSETHYKAVQERLKKFVEVGQARALRQRLLGQPLLQAAPRGKPHHRVPLPGCPAGLQGRRPDDGHLRRQEPPPADARRRRRDLASWIRSTPTGSASTSSGSRR